MIVLPEFNPFVFTIAEGVGLRWYALMYILGFLIAWLQGRRHLHEVDLTEQGFVDLITTIAFGVILGGRVGYVLIYQWVQWLQNPLLLFMLWHGGMSFHGALVGGSIAVLYFAKLQQQYFFKLIDFVVPLIPPGIMLGRLGNFINGELWGRVSSMPWAMVFPHSDLLPRHPSQLYEMFGEGLLLYILLNYQRQRGHAHGHLGMWFLIHYAWIRFIIEFFREPDVQLGFVFFNVLTMGQFLCLLMLISAVIMLCIDKYVYPILDYNELR